MAVTPLLAATAPFVGLSRWPTAVVRSLQFVFMSLAVY